VTTAPSAAPGKDLSLEQPTLTTERLILRPFEPADAPAVRTLAGTREIADTTLHVPHPYPEGAAEQWIATHATRFTAGTLATYAIVGHESSEVVGAVGLAIEPQHALAELGYWVGVPFWGRGYATEAARALVSFGFNAYQLHRVQARHMVRNPASGRVMQKLGMRYEGTHRDAVRKWDRFEDIAVYAVLAADWNARSG
jgi:[ribosomal protein S5]-alanine N-acetyltransferase